jgi:YXWGXW repeat-containing protein
MRLFRSARWILMALLLCLVPASSYAGVFISVGFAPPVLPVYVQPECPQPGLMWTPGYWAYGDDGYYWVPGAWVPAPYEGALWTPPYWGWSGGLYVWHPGYWGPHVGYYGGVNYGFGYMGIGFAGGIWRGHDFVYNTAVVRVNTTIIHNTYIDRTVVERNTIVNDRHVAFSGGPGGINHPPAPEERAAMNEHHLAPTSFQTQHMNSAMSDHNSYFKANGGHPQNLAVARPLPAENHPAPSFNNNHGATPGNNHAGPTQSFGAQSHSMNQNEYHPAPQNNQYRSAPQNQYRPATPNQYHPTPQSQPQNQYHPAPQNQPHNDSHPSPQSRPQPHDSHDRGKGR